MGAFFRFAFLLLVGCSACTKAAAPRAPSECDISEVLVGDLCRKACSTNGDCDGTVCKDYQGLNACSDDVACLDTQAFDGAKCRDLCNDDSTCDGNMCKVVDQSSVKVCSDDMAEIGGVGCGYVDNDADGYGDSCDACPGEIRIWGIGNTRTGCADSDLDCICNDEDSCVDGVTDGDQDGTPDACDICPSDNTAYAGHYNSACLIDSMQYCLRTGLVDVPQELSQPTTCLPSPEDSMKSQTIAGSQYHADSDCDGVDGVKSQSLFVRCDADAIVADGTLDKPFQTISKALACIVNSSLSGCSNVANVIGVISTFNATHDPDIKINVMVSAENVNGDPCTYAESLDVSNAVVNVFGAYRQDFHVRLPGSPSVVAPTTTGPALFGNGQYTDVLFDGFKFVAQVGNVSAPTSVGIVIGNARAFKLKSSEVQSGKGYDNATLSAPVAPSPSTVKGCNGGIATCQGQQNDNDATYTSAGGQNLNTGSCRHDSGINGGEGKATRPSGGCSGGSSKQNFAAGNTSQVSLEIAGQPGTGGTAANQGCTSDSGNCCGCARLYSGGGGGSGSTPAGSSINLSTYWNFLSQISLATPSALKAVNGANGLNGLHGGSGGGGAGGGLWQCENDDNYVAVGGSAGGAGGTGGTGGIGGIGGGHSIALWIHQSSSSNAVELSCNRLNVQSGGIGQSGGSGGLGAAGGSGGETKYCDIDETDITSGAGGNGGQGGRGAPGQGGSGGASVPILFTTDGVNSAGPYCIEPNIYCMISTQTPAMGGAGGAGYTTSTSTTLDPTKNGLKGLDGVINKECACNVSSSPVSCSCN